MVTYFRCKLKGHISNQYPNLQIISDKTPIILSPDKNIKENMTINNKFKTITFIQFKYMIENLQETQI
jgi:hypothetical protein